jgi:conjugative transfer signal peptidase TraF
MAEPCGLSPAATWLQHCGSRGAIFWSGAGLAVGMGLAFTIIWPPLPLLLWNASPSSPVGLYALSSSAALRVGDIAVAWAPPAARRMAARRSYLPFDVPLVKRVAATAGDRVCAKGDRIYLDGRVVANRIRRDPSGRPLPWWSGCVRLGPGELFLLSPGNPEAFDGRYFGVTRPWQVVGKAELLLPWPGSSRG